MRAFLVRRFINLIPTFLLATLLAWVIIDIAPGDFASQFAFDQVDTNKEQRIRELLGLGQPWYVRYWRWLVNLVTVSEGSPLFDFGTSMVSKGSVTARVWPRMINSMVLALPALIMIFAISIPIGVYSARRKYSLADRSLTVFSLIGLAIPNFFMALILLGLIVNWFQTFGWFILPTGGMTSNNYAQLSPLGKFLDVAWHSIFPLFVVVLSGLAGTTRIMRGQMLETFSQDYVRTARAKGLSDNTVTYKHTLRNAVLPIIATVGSAFTGVLLGSGVVEFVTGWPGLTPLFIGSVFAQDVYVLMAILTIATILLMLGNLISDVLLAVVDPRIRY